MNEQKQALTPEWQTAVDRWKSEYLIVEVDSNSITGISCIDITDAEVGDVNIRISVVWQGLIRKVYMAAPFNMTRATAFHDDGNAFETKTIGYVNELLDYARNEDMVRRYKQIQYAANELQKIAPEDAVKLTDSEVATIMAGTKWIVSKTEEERSQPAEAPDVLSVPRKDLYTVYTAALALLQKAEEWDFNGHTPSVPEIEDLVETLRAHKEDLQGLLDGGTGAGESELATSIEWADEVWNPVTGLSKVSEGCRNCYAEATDRRFASQFGHEHKPWTAANAVHNVRLHPDRITQPLAWRKPRRVFVNSMSDLFHDRVPFEIIATVWAIMWRTPQHTYQILTKRPERMLEFFQWNEQQQRGLDAAAKFPHPLPNVWIGVSVEDQKTANVRIPLLLQTPVAVRFLSCEPLLGPVSIFDVDDTIGLEGSGPGFPKEPQLHWVIAGGESGPGARPMHPEWARTLRDQCESANIPFFFKQWGVWAPLSDLRKEPNCKEGILHENGEFFLGASWLQRDRSGDDQRGDYMQMFRVGKKEAGRLLDGREWNGMPLVQEETAMLAHYCGTCNLTFAVSTDLKDQTDLSCPECREGHELEEIGEVKVKPSGR